MTLKLNGLFALLLSIPTFCFSKPLNKETSGPECVASICVPNSNPYPFKNNKLKLKNIFGKAPVISSGDEDLAYFCYSSVKNETIVFSYNSYEDSIWAVGISSHYKCKGQTVKYTLNLKLTTENKIKLGDSKKEVIAKYGNPSFKSHLPEEIIRYISYDNDLSPNKIPDEIWIYSNDPRTGFAFLEGKITDIFIDSNP